jgi:hypothetical protein
MQVLVTYMLPEYPSALPCPVPLCSNTVGTPLAAMLRDAGAAAVTVCHRTSYQE